MNIKAIIIEDEELSAERLEMLIVDIEPSIQIINTFESIASAKQFLKKGDEVDLIFLDINLSDGSAFQLLKEVKITIPIIFTTAYDAFALDAFKYNSIDYLLKPIDKNELEVAINKFKQQEKSKKIDYHLLLETISSKKNEFQTRILVAAGKKIFPLLVANIAYIYAEDKLVFAKGSAGATYILSDTVDHYQKCLDPNQFFRVNRKTLVQLNNVTELKMDKKNRWHLLVQPKAHFDIPIPVEKLSAIKKWLT